MTEQRQKLIPSAVQCGTRIAEVKRTHNRHLRAHIFAGLAKPDGGAPPHDLYLKVALSWRVCFNRAHRCMKTSTLPYEGLQGTSSTLRRVQATHRLLRCVRAIGGGKQGSGDSVGYSLRAFLFIFSGGGSRNRIPIRMRRTVMVILVFHSIIKYFYEK